MRELKFRSWCVLNGKGSFIYYDLDGRREFDFDIFDEEVVTQQFTGLLDNKKREIYEGDILKFIPTHKGDTKFVGEVFYEEDEAAFYHTFEEGRPSKRLWGTFSNYKYEVIGNIFENPNLLK